MKIFIYHIPKFPRGSDLPLWIKDPTLEDDPNWKSWYDPDTDLQEGVFYTLWMNRRANQAEFLVNDLSVYVSELIDLKIGFQIIYE